MPTYVAKLRKTSGETEEKLLTVPDETLLGEYLSRLDGFVVGCTPYDDEPETLAPTVAMTVQTTVPVTQTKSSGRGNASELLAFTWYLQTMVAAGIPLARALGVIQGQLESASWHRVIGQVISQLEKGESFADSLKRHPKFFPEHFVHLIDVGEISGNLDRVLTDLAAHGEKQLETRSQIKSALAYPLVLLTACGGVCVFLVAVVLPRISKIFTRLELDLPWITQMLLGVSAALRSGLPLILSAIAAATIGGFLALRTPTGRQLWHTALLRCPGFGMFYKKVLMSRFCRTLALLLQSGVPLLVSLELARAGLGNQVLEQFIADVERELQEGASLGEELARSPHIPDIVSTMVSVGEESGQLSHMFANVSRFYERDVDRTVKALPKILEPLIIVFMTAIVGLIGASVFIPLAQIPQGFGPK